MSKNMKYFLTILYGTEFDSIFNVTKSCWIWFISFTTSSWKRLNSYNDYGRITIIKCSWCLNICSITYPTTSWKEKKRILFQRKKDNILIFIFLCFIVKNRYTAISVFLLKSFYLGYFFMPFHHDWTYAFCFNRKFVNIFIISAIKKWLWNIYW